MNGSPDFHRYQREFDERERQREQEDRQRRERTRWDEPVWPDESSENRSE